MTHLFFNGHPIKWFKSREPVDKSFMITLVILSFFAVLMWLISLWFSIPYTVALICGIIAIYKCPTKPI